MAKIAGFARPKRRQHLPIFCSGFPAMPPVFSRRMPAFPGTAEGAVRVRRPGGADAGKKV
jgi:hypothetical protein